MSFFNVFRFIESVLVHDTNNVHLNKGLHLYLVGISFLGEKIIQFLPSPEKLAFSTLRGLVRTATICKLYCTMHLEELE